jgi:microcystin-dependent protein
MKKTMFVFCVVLFLKISAFAQDPYIGEIKMVPYNFVPIGWALCDGSLLQISQFQALYSLLGTTYGGDGKSTFALPDLRGRIPVAAGTAAGQTKKVNGEKGGAEMHTLTVAEMPTHTHALPVSSSVGTSDSPAGNYLAKNSEGVKQFAAAKDNSTAVLGTAGNGTAFNIMPPYLVVNFIIALQGIYPSRE